MDEDNISDLYDPYNTQQYRGMKLDNETMDHHLQVCAVAVVIAVKIVKVIVVVYFDDLIYACITFYAPTLTR